MKQKGFTLLELLIVVGLLSVLALTIAPGILKSQAEKVTVEGLKKNIVSVLDAARRYRFDCGAWPNGINRLISPPPGCSGNPTQQPYLPAGFQLNNPLGGAITFNYATNYFNVDVPINADFSHLKGYFRELPGYTDNGASIRFTVVAPGLEVSLSNVGGNFHFCPGGPVNITSNISLSQTTPHTFILLDPCLFPNGWYAPPAKAALFMFRGLKANGYPVVLRFRKNGYDYPVFWITGGEDSAQERTAGPNSQMSIVPLEGSIQFTYYWSGDTSGWSYFTAQLIGYYD
jgi:prepilin-type N-terminal cleavage/methylation domain-containing protein